MMVSIDDRRACAGVSSEVLWQDGDDDFDGVVLGGNLAPLALFASAVSNADGLDGTASVETQEQVCGGELAQD
jgi:hypothetical protein